MAIRSVTAITCSFGTAQAARMPARALGASVSRPRSINMAASQQLIAEIPTACASDSRRINRGESCPSASWTASAV